VEIHTSFLFRPHVKLQSYFAMKKPKSKKQKSSHYTFIRMLTKMAYKEPKYK